MEERLRQEILAVLARGGKLAALAALRDKTSMSLPEAKAVIDALALPANLIEVPRELLDLAAELETGSRPPGERERLAAQAAARWGRERWESAAARARDLAEAAYTLCDRSRSGEFSDDEVVQRLRRTCPSFGDKAYSSAFNRGMTDSR